MRFNAFIRGEYILLDFPVQFLSRFVRRSLRRLAKETLLFDLQEEESDDVEFKQASIFSFKFVYVINDADV